MARMLVHGDDEHEWRVEYFVPDPTEENEHQHPYTVETCECGHRRTRRMTSEEVEAAGVTLNRPFEEITTEETEA